MDIFSFISVALTVFLALFVSWALLLPFLSRREIEFSAEDLLLEKVLQPLSDKKEQTLLALEELELDYREEKISSEFYHQTKGELAMILSECMKNLEDIESTGRDSKKMGQVEPLSAKQVNARS